MTPLASPLGPKVAPQPGDFFGRYELLCVIGRGGMGTVWLAVPRDSALEVASLVALKTILHDHSGNHAFRRMFLDEARIASQIRHPNVARILEISDERGALYYTMEYVEGESVAHLNRAIHQSGAGFPVPAALRICADACLGLHAAHELRSESGELFDVVHRDVSPQNLLVTPAGAIKLIDFGIAKARDRLTPETALGTLKGRIEYMAPEQARGGAIDRRADVYSVGSVLYRLISGKPVHDTDVEALLRGVPHAPLDDGVPGSVQQVIDVALAGAPENRFATALELRAAIEEAMLTSHMSCEPYEVAALLARHSKRGLAQKREQVQLALKASAERRRQPSAPVRAASPHSVGEYSLTLPVGGGDERLGRGSDAPRADRATAGFDAVMARALELAAEGHSAHPPARSSDSRPSEPENATAAAINLLLHAASEQLRDGRSSHVRQSGSRSESPRDSGSTQKSPAPFHGDPVDVTHNTVVNLDALGSTRVDMQLAPPVSDRARRRDTPRPSAPPARRGLTFTIALAVFVVFLVMMITFRAAKRYLESGFATSDVPSVDLPSPSDVHVTAPPRAQPVLPAPMTPPTGRANSNSAPAPLPRPVIPVERPTAAIPTPERPPRAAATSKPPGARPPSPPPVSPPPAAPSLPDDLSTNPYR